MNRLSIAQIVYKGKSKAQHYVDSIKASKDEYEFAKACIENGISFTFQPDKVSLIEGFQGSLKNYRDTTYTADFDTPYGIVEIKGFMRADNSLKHKLADKYYSDRDIKYFVLKWKGSIKEGTKGFYPYSWSQFKTIKDKDELKKREWFSIVKGE